MTQQLYGQSMPFIQDQSQQNTQNLRGFWGILKRRSATIFTTTAILFGLALVAMVLIRPLYTAETQLLIDPRDRNVLRTEVAPTGLGTDQTLIESQVRLLSSDAIFSRVIAQENLLEDVEFGQIDPSSPIIRLKSILALFIPIDPMQDEMSPQVRALKKMRKLVSIRRSERTYMVDIRASSRDADKAKRIADGIANAYLADQRDAASETTHKATSALTGRLEELRQNVSRTEQQVEEFRRSQNLPMAEGRLINEQQVTELSNLLITARSRTAETRAKYEHLQRALSAKLDDGALADAMQSGVIANLRGQLAQTSTNEAQLLQRLGQRHPAVQDVRAEMANIRRLIQEELRRVATLTRNEYDVAKANEDSLSLSLDKLKGVSFDNNQAMVRLRELQREAEANRSLYEAFLTRAKQTSEQERIQTVQARVIAPALMPHENSYPPRLLIMALALLGGLGLGSALALVREHFDDSVHSAADLRRLAGLDLLAIIPTQRTTADILDQSHGSMAAAMRSLRNELRASGAPSDESKTLRSLLITSAHEGEGKSTVALNLALAAALAGERVLLVDVDYAQHSLSQRIAPSAHIGLEDVLNGSSQLMGALVHDPRSTLYALPLAHDKNGVLQRPSAADIARLLEMAQAQFDFVVLDAPALLQERSARMFASVCDEVLLVVRSGTTSAQSVTQAMQTLREDASKVRGCVLNQTSAVQKA